jgi:outer membrane murein-binding lipoprotein Lpp
LKVGCSKGRLFSINDFLRKGVEMKKVILAMCSVSLLLSVGCASKDYVRQQVEPLVERISKLEAQGDCCDQAKEAARKCEKKCEKSFELQQQK